MPKGSRVSGTPSCPQLGVTSVRSSCSLRRCSFPQIVFSYASMFIECASLIMPWPGASE